MQDRKTLPWGVAFCAFGGLLFLPPASAAAMLLDARRGQGRAIVHQS